jgi:hypothetical protein
LIQPIDDLAVATTIIDQPLHLIATVAATLLAGHAKHIELAGEVAEYDRPSAYTAKLFEWLQAPSG